jgi:hypothetical protein
MPKPATHILIKYPDRNMDLLYRAKDGMSLGCRNGISVMFGESPNPAHLEHRTFLDETFARGFLRHCADLDANGIKLAEFRPGEPLPYAASIEERDGESRIVAPSGQISYAKH